MTIFWPGLIIGLLLIIGSIVAYIKRRALSDVVGDGVSQIIGKQNDEGQESKTAHLMIPIFGGMAMGFALVVFSLTGVMR
jgi:uncharacterized membrane protein